MALATVTSRVDELDKAAFDDFCSSVGLTSSAAINMYVKVVVRDHKLSFDVK
jgi:DNA-damage-inducible protein J